MAEKSGKLRKVSRPPSFKLEIPADETNKQIIMDKMHKVRDRLVQLSNRPVNNREILETVLDKWIEANCQENQARHSIGGSYLKVKKQDVNQKLFITAQKSLMKLVDIASAHGKICDANLKVSRNIHKGHVSSLKLQCLSAEPHKYSWSSSPYLPNGKYFINEKINHAFDCSGMLPSHYTRFCSFSGIGLINKSNREKFYKRHKDSISSEYNESIQTALLEEVGSYETLDGINILTDARHGWRKNTKDTSVVAIGEETHKVIDCIHITKSDDNISQRHEIIGTTKLYEKLERETVNVKTHTHDRNVAVNKFIKSSPLAEETLNQNDTWHAVKKIKPKMQSISSGPLKYKGISWSEQLSDKIEPVVTHFHWCIKNCNNDPQVLRNNLINIINHYKNDHSSCNENSRCKKDPKYEPKRIIITDKIAEKLLRQVIEDSVIYKYPEDFVLAKDTFYVESFNNVMNVFQDKRIAFTDDHYRSRSQLAVCMWNENVDRHFTSVWKARDPRAPRSQRGKKIYKARTYKFRENIWKNYVNSLFQRPRR
ncbi:hypothetical protein KUTeg_024524 [Tegillarca granosa]|uniref:Mutator-like transposase domain-containing protein n=1 Tax=Tegillarca granosa TaxID=220873 RepID=A0ABQ9DXL4_TEGGR|nr:hypothetical protein KUTeg_024524 [Tegillarca granosa]